MKKDSCGYIGLSKCDKEELMNVANKLANGRLSTGFLCSRCKEITQVDLKTNFIGQPARRFIWRWCNQVKDAQVQKILVNRTRVLH